MSSTTSATTSASKSKLTWENVFRSRLRDASAFDWIADELTKKSRPISTENAERLLEFMLTRSAQNKHRERATRLLRVLLSDEAVLPALALNSGYGGWTDDTKSVLAECFLHFGDPAAAPRAVKDCLLPFISNILENEAIHLVQYQCLCSWNYEAVHFAFESLPGLYFKFVVPTYGIDHRWIELMLRLLQRDRMAFEFCHQPLDYNFILLVPSLEGFSTLRWRHLNSYEKSLILICLMANSMSPYWATYFLEKNIAFVSSSLCPALVTFANYLETDLIPRLSVANAELVIATRQQTVHCSKTNEPMLAETRAITRSNPLIRFLGEPDGFWYEGVSGARRLELRAESTQKYLSSAKHCYESIRGALQITFARYIISFQRAFMTITGRTGQPFPITLAAEIMILTGHPFIFALQSGTLTRYKDPVEDEWSTTTESVLSRVVKFVENAINLCLRMQASRIQTRSHTKRGFGVTTSPAKRSRYSVLDDDEKSIDNTDDAEKDTAADGDDDDEEEYVDDDDDNYTSE